MKPTEDKEAQEKLGESLWMYFGRHLGIWEFKKLRPDQKALWLWRAQLQLQLLERLGYERKK